MPNGNTIDADKPAYDKPSWTIVHDGWSYANLFESSNLSLKASIIVEAPPSPPPSYFITGRPKASLLFLFFGGLRCGV